MTATLHESALWYASVGLLVFPLQPGAKVPFKGSNGFKGATTDVEMINKWWTGNPAANIGLATGHLVDVVDIDGPAGQQSRVRHWCDDLACREAGSQPQPPSWWTPHCDHPGTFNRIDRDAVARVLTPRPGGLHIWVPATGDGNSAGIVPGVDVRGLGGYVVAPPSILDDRSGQHAGTYRFLGVPRLPNQAGAAA